MDYFTIHEISNRSPICLSICLCQHVGLCLSVRLSVNQFAVDGFRIKISVEIIGTLTFEIMWLKPLVMAPNLYIAYGYYGYIVLKPCRKMKSSAMLLDLNI